MARVIFFFNFRTIHTGKRTGLVLLVEQKVGIWTQFGHMLISVNPQTNSANARAIYSLSDVWCLDYLNYFHITVFSLCVV